jgi:hypothetical protein
LKTLLARARIYHFLQERERQIIGKNDAVYYICPRNM